MGQYDDNYGYDDYWDAPWDPSDPGDEGYNDYYQDFNAGFNDFFDGGPHDDYNDMNYSPGESHDRPPAFMDWDDDGIIDETQGGNRYDSNGNLLNTTDENGYRVGDWLTNPNDWTWNGSDGGGWEHNHNDSPSYSDAYSDSYSDSGSYSPPATPYIPPAPTPPPVVPQAPPDPGPAPTFAKENQKELVKYEYVYGIKDLQIKGNEYTDRSIYVSKPLQIEGNVMQIGLQAVEEHPLFSSISGEATERQTSVEYYISYVENPSLEDWHPILPEDQKTIPCELLIFDTARTATLRFPALVYSTPEARVFKNGIKYNNWAFTSGGTKVQLLEELSPGAIYTISYVPNAEIDDPWVIDIYQKGVKTAKQVDTFTDGANHNKTLILSKYPYINYEAVNPVTTFDPNTNGYRPISVTLQNAKIQATNKTFIKEVLPYVGATTEPRTFNITDYKTKEWKQPKSYSLAKNDTYLNFDYYHEGNKLYFSETFNKADVLANQEINHGNAEIKVEYEYLVSNFRVKIILRRTGAAINSVSPIVQQYALKFKAMK